MNKFKHRGGKGMGVAAVTALLAFGFLFAADGSLYLKIHQSIDIFSKVYKEIALNYVDEVDPERFMRAGIDGMLRTLDPYTVYIGEHEGDELDLVTTGKYGGVGISIGMRDGIITVVNLLEGYSAAKQGIEIGDRIVQIGETNVVGATLEEVRQLVRGAPGTDVRLTVERDIEPQRLEFVLVREEIPVRNVTYAGIIQDGIGYVRLERFSRSAADDVRGALKKLKDSGKLKGVVLDLRDNPGGLLDIAVEVTSKFVPESSLIVSTRGRKDDAERKYYSTDPPILADVPLAVLVNRNSASASEIVAGAIQDLDRGLIVGTRTFGKGLVQTISRLSDKSSLKITTARYYTPSGRCIQEIDYTNNTRDGVFASVPDSVRKEYRTTHDRKVFEAGGVEPDSTLSDDAPPKLIAELLRKAMVFKFATRFAANNKSLPANFEVTDAMLSEFESFLKEKKFEYQEDAEIRLKELGELAEQARYGKAFGEELQHLVDQVAKEKGRAMERYRTELKSLLKTEITGRLHGEQRRIESTFADDRQLKTAIALLASKKTYDRILVNGD